MHSPQNEEEFETGIDTSQLLKSITKHSNIFIVTFCDQVSK